MISYTPIGEIATHDRVSGEERGKNARPELPNLSIHGITPNGTYFFANLVYKKGLAQRQNISIFHYKCANYCLLFFDDNGFSLCNNRLE